MMDIMLFLWLLVLLACGVYVDSYSVSVIRCEGRLCLYKFGEPYNSGKWQESYDSCVNNGMKLLTIDNQNVQDDVERLLNDESSEHVTSIWIAGRGNGDTTWRYINDSVFNHTVSLPTTGTENEAHCVRVTVDTYSDKKGVDQYNNEQCYEKQSTAQLVCQYDPKITENGHCDDGHLYYGDKCYIKTQYDGRSDQYKIDWFNAETYCNGLKADIMYSNIDDLLKSHEADLLNTATRPLLLWVGVRRYKWYWETGSGATRQTSPIRYYNWKNNEGGYPYTRCIYIDHKDDDKWNSVNCGDYNEYFICVNTKTPDTTTSTTSTSNTPTTTMTISTSLSGTVNDVTPPSYTDSPYVCDKTGLISSKYVYLATGINIIILVGVGIGVTVYCLRVKSGKPNISGDVHRNVEPTNSAQSVPNDLEYEIVTSPHHDAAPQDNTSPYTELNLREMTNNHNQYDNLRLQAPV